MTSEEQAEQIRMPFIYKYGSEDKYNYMIMTLLGNNLAQKRAEHKGLELATVLKIAL